MTEAPYIFQNIRMKASIKQWQVFLYLASIQ